MRYVTNSISYLTNLISYVTNSISYVTNLISYITNLVGYVTNSISYVNVMEYTIWRGKLLHEKEPEKVKLVSKISVFVLCPLSSVLCPLSSVLCPLSFALCPLSFVLGKRCWLPWAWRRPDDIARSVNDGGALQWTSRDLLTTVELCSEHREIC